MIKMTTKNLMVFFLAFASVILITGIISASELVNIDAVKINGVQAFGDEVAVDAGKTISIQVFFTALVDAADVRMKVELEGRKIDVDAETDPFNVEAGKVYSKFVLLEVPQDFGDQVSRDATLDIKIWNDDYRTEYSNISLRVQRQSYNAVVMSIDSLQTFSAGKLYPVDVVLKNTGYNELEDVYVTLKISELGIERKIYFGDIVAVDDDENEDSIQKRFFLEIPYSAKSGTYNLEVEAYNTDFSTRTSKKIQIISELSGKSLVVTSTSKSASIGDKAQFDVVLVNPTNDLRVFRIVTESSDNLITDSNAQIVSIPAGMSKSIKITAEPRTKGDHSFDVNLFAGEQLVDSVTLNVSASRRVGNPTIILTVILIIVLLVLVGVLYVLLRKKSNQKTEEEEYGESYY